jgi:hypothetical protein
MRRILFRWQQLLHADHRNRERMQRGVVLDQVAVRLGHSYGVGDA